MLIHGLGASSNYWRPVVQELGPDATVICPDLLGFGRSPKPHAAYSVIDHVTTLNAMLDRAAPCSDPVVLSGHSTGAVLALAWAAAYPERFRGVALFALPAYRSQEEALARLGAISPLAWATVAQPSLGELICGVMCVSRPLLRAVLPLITRGVPAAAARDAVLHTWVSYSGTLQNVLVEHRVAPGAAELAATGMPVRLVHGRRDRAAPPAAAHSLAQAHGWPITVLDCMGHQLPVDAPAACAAAISSLVASSGT